MFFDALVGPLLAIGTVLMSLIPIIYVFSEFSPVVAPR